MVKSKTQSVKSGSELLPHSKVLLLTDGDVTMPDMKGWTKDDVLAFQSLTNIKVITKGTGFVTDQSISNGTKLKKAIKLSLHFQQKMLMAVNQKSKLLHRIRMIQPITKSKIKRYI